MKRMMMALVVAAAVAPAFAQIQSKARDGVDVAMDAFLAGVNNHDPKAIAASFAKDGDIIDSYGAKAKGRKDIEKFFANRQSPLSMNSTATFQIYDRKTLKDGLLLVDADGTLAGLATKDGKTLPDMKNHVVIVFAKNGDGWDILSLRAYAFTPLAGVSDTSPAVPAANSAPVSGAVPATPAPSAPPAK